MRCDLNLTSLTDLRVFVFKFSLDAKLKLETIEILNLLISKLSLLITIFDRLIDSSRLSLNIYSLYSITASFLI